MLRRAYENFDKNIDVNDREEKIVISIEEAIKRSGLSDGMTISFTTLFVEEIKF